VRRYGHRVSRARPRARPRRGSQDSQFATRRAVRHVRARGPDHRPAVASQRHRAVSHRPRARPPVPRARAVAGRDAGLPAGAARRAGDRRGGRDARRDPASAGVYPRARLHSSRPVAAQRVHHARRAHQAARLRRGDRAPPRRGHGDARRRHAWLHGAGARIPARPTGRPVGRRRGVSRVRHGPAARARCRDRPPRRRPRADPPRRDPRPRRRAGAPSRDGERDAPRGLGLAPRAAASRLDPLGLDGRRARAHAARRPRGLRAGRRGPAGRGATGCRSAHRRGAPDRPHGADRRAGAWRLRCAPSSAGGRAAIRLAPWRARRRIGSRCTARGILSRCTSTSARRPGPLRRARGCP